ncbi:MAG: SPOR domain-containing protein, partial [candidate division KSB1 bacterium]|nr:SPOR domain-containing protein [candidate division KSB1 bacterium]
FERCRRRLFSFSPDGNRILFSVYTPQKGEQTWLMHSDGTNLKLVDDTGYYFVSWLDNRRYLCTSPKGFFQRSVDGSENVKLDDWPIPQWCQAIDLSLPGFEIQITCEENKQQADSLLAFLKTQGFRGRTEFYQDKGTKCYRVRMGPYTSLKQAKDFGKKLSSLGFQFWIDKIESVYAYLLKARAEDEAVFGDKKAVIEYQINHFPRSRILLRDVKRISPFQSGEKKQILVDEMNNF